MKTWKWNTSNPHFEMLISKEWRTDRFHSLLTCSVHFWLCMLQMWLIVAVIFCPFLIVHVAGTTDCCCNILSVFDWSGAVPEYWLLSLGEPDLQDGWCQQPVAEHVSSAVPLLWPTQVWPAAVGKPASWGWGWRGHWWSSWIDFSPHLIDPKHTRDEKNAF